MGSGVATVPRFPCYLCRNIFVSTSENTAEVLASPDQICIRENKMSEVADTPAEIVTAKSEDKLEIEKEEQEKVEVKEKVAESSSEKEKDTEKDEKAETGEKDESSEEKGEKDVTDSEKKDTETSDEKDKKFSMPKIKTPK